MPATVAPAAPAAAVVVKAIPPRIASEPLNDADPDAIAEAILPAYSAIMAHPAMPAR